MPNPSHDLFLLLLNISQIKSRELIIETFIEAGSELFPQARLLWLEPDGDFAGEVVEIATLKKSFGRIGIATDGEDLSADALPLLRNAVRMLALILEKDENDRLLADEKALLSSMVDTRTRELESSNRQLKEEVSERIRTEKRLQREMTFTESLINTLGDTLFVMDPVNNKAIRWNHAFSRISGYSDEEIAAMPALQTYHAPEDIEAYLQLVADVQRTGRGRIELDLLCKDGGKVPTEYMVSLVPADPDHSADQYLIAIGRDISERKRAEKQRAQLEVQLNQAKKMESIGRLAGGVAHDFNNLLTGITGNVQLAQMDMRPDDPLYHMLDEVHEAADRAADLTRQLLAFSRKQLIQPKVIDLNELLGNMHRMLTRIIGEDIILKVVPAAELGRVKADPNQLEQIVLNLAANARDAMPDGGRLMIETGNISLDDEYCRAHHGLLPGRYVMLAISDNGEGFDEETRRQIFDPFFTTKKEGKGTGLGLAMVYGIVRQHNGHIHVYSEVGSGTSFKVYLPQVDGKAERLSAKRITEKIPGGSETILVVEDERMVRATAVKILKRLGYRTIEAESGERALEAIKAQDSSIDLLLTDVVMPHMNGRELAREARKLLPHVKVLYTSGYTENTIAHHGILDDGLAFIEKPYSPRALALKLRMLLDD